MIAIPCYAWREGKGGKRVNPPNRPHVIVIPLISYLFLQGPVFPRGLSDINSQSLPSSCTAFSQAFTVNPFRWRIQDQRPGKGSLFRLDHVTRNGSTATKYRGLGTRQSQSYAMNFSHLDSWADSHAMLRVFREWTNNQNGGTCGKRHLYTFCGQTWD